VDLTKTTVILENIPVNLDVKVVLNLMKVSRNTQRYENTLREMIDRITPVARPKAMYRICCVEKKGAEALEIEGVKFNSQLLLRNLDKTETVFVSLATAGAEIEAMTEPGDVMQRFCLDMAKNGVLFAATTYLNEHLNRRYHTGQISILSPGETEAFPIDQQRPLLSLLGDYEKLMGVRLTENCALIPVKSRSGILYATETEFVSCRLCTNQRCMGRRAAYEPELARQYSQPAAGK
jgi:hypothetical protein